MKAALTTSAPKQAPVAAASPAKVAVTPASRVFLQRKCACGGKPGSSGDCEECSKQKQVLQRRAAGSGEAGNVPPVVHRVLSSPGHSLDGPTRGFMEPRFGHDFGQVRIHDDAQAADAARSVNAHAFTVGDHIAFASGKYAPHTADGQQLLAHELAHTVQQRGLQRSSNDVAMPLSGEEQHFEREADAAAAAALHRDSSAIGSPIVPSGMARPYLLRQACSPKTHDGTPARCGGHHWRTEETTPDEEAESWAVDELIVLGGLKDTFKGDWLTQVVTPVNDAKTTDATRRGFVDGMRVKHDAGTLRLEIVEVKSCSTMGGGCARATTEAEGYQRVLRQIVPQIRQVSQAIGSTESQTPNTKGSAKADKRDLKTAGIDLSDKATNDAWAFLQSLKNKLGTFPTGLTDVDVQLFKQGDPGVTYLAASAPVPCKGDQGVKRRELSFQVNGNGGVSYKCKDGPCGAAAPGTAKGEAEKPSAQPAPDVFELKYEDRTAKLELAPGWLKDNKARDVPLAEPASKLIPGFVLKKFSRQKAKRLAIHGNLDVEGLKLADHLKVKGETTLAFTVDEATGVVKLTAESKSMIKVKGIPIDFSKLSPGAITTFESKPEGVEFAGWIKPSIPLLGKLDIEYKSGELRVIKALNEKDLKPPFPGVKITKAQVGLKLAPDFQPSGDIAMELSAGQKKILDAALRVTVSPSGGFLATGTLNAYIPGVDKADGEVKYQDGQWSGSAKVESTQIKLPYVRSGVVTAGFNDKGVFGGGTIELDVPGGHAATVGLTYANAKWIFKGEGKFNIPRLDPVKVYITYDDGKLSGWGETGFTFKSLRGNIKLQYLAKKGEDTAKIWGDGKLEIDKGRAKGRANVHLHETGRFSGEGEISYEIKPGLVAKAGIKIDPNEKVTLMGSLTFPPYQLFKRFPDPPKRITIFELPTISIPIPGASIGPVGLQARIDAGIYADYGIGPGEIRDGYVKTLMNPLEENPNLDLEIGGQVYIPAHFSITGEVSGSVALDLKIASVAGGLTVSVTASLDGHVLSNLKAHYAQGKFEAQADFEMILALALYLALKAFVKAEAGVWRFKITTTKEWELAKFQFDTGMKLGLKLKKPVSYSSERGFEAPSLNDIEWILPKFEPKKAVEESFNRDKGKEDPPYKEEG